MLRNGPALLLLLALLGPGCAREVIGEPPPLDRPHYPVGLALHPEGRWLAVTASNFDLEYSHGALLLADLERVDAALAGAEAGTRIVIPGADTYVAGAQVPAFGNRPAFAFEGDSILLTTRSENRIVELGVEGADTDEPTLECDTVGEDNVPRCTSAPSALQLSGNDPFELVVFTDRDPQRAVVSGLGASSIFFIRFERDINDAFSFRVNRPLVLDDLAPDGEIIGVRGLALRPEGNGLGSPRIFATLERTTNGLRGRAADLIWFDPSAGGPAATVSRLSLTAASGGLETRAAAVSPTGDAVFVLMRDPDALVRIDLFSAGGGFSPRPGGVTSTCFAPTQLAVAAIPTAGGETRERVLVTCYDNETVLAYDSLTLSETDAVRFFGRGPYDVLVDTAAETPRAYVSFFQDDSIGILDLVDDAGDARLVPRGRIGEQRDPPEDNR